MFACVVTRSRSKEYSNGSPHGEPDSDRVNRFGPPISAVHCLLRFRMKSKRKLEASFLPLKLNPAAGTRMANLRIICLNVRGRLTRRGNILRIRVFQNFLRSLDLVRGVTVDGKQNAALLQASFVTLRFILRDSQADQRTGDSANCSSYSDPGESRHDWPSRYERPKPWDRKQPYPREQSECPAKNRTCASAGCRAFGSLSCLFGCDGFRAEILR